MLIKRIVVGPLEVNCYIAADERAAKALVIDPGGDADLILDFLKQKGFHTDYIICTHGHFDHVGAVRELKDATGAKLLLHHDEIEIYHAGKDMAAFWGCDIGDLVEPDAFLKEGDSITVGALTFEVLHTPGHSPGGICLYGAGIAFTGDTLFAGSIGRTDFAGGDFELIKKSFRLLMALPEEIKVLPGHGPESTIGNEKRHNMFAAEFLQSED